MTSFPDQAHIERIRVALWRGREYGQAAVMVGAGLSLNAEPTSASTPPFPTWARLVQRLVEDLYAHDSDLSRQRAMRQASSTSGALRLADEYEAAFGREALDRFLLSQIPDAGYRPSRLHKLLLGLPWADVFTTNYDTLLERGAEGLVDRKYAVVRTVSEVASASKPRIVKLHGSFPSTRPFIFTEEDFRTYPRCFAPFVNVAQQAIMENTLCLIGFSGDDPNFLYWTGWVRDNLGKSRPPIYLCGVLNQTSAQRKLLQGRNVIPIDLSLLFPVADWGGGNRARCEGA